MEQEVDIIEQLENEALSEKFNSLTVESDTNCNQVLAAMLLALTLKGLGVEKISLVRRTCAHFYNCGKKSAIQFVVQQADLKASSKI
jgi:hypothetical protein